MDNPLEVFYNLGWDLEKSGTQLLCDCPFCGKRKMYVDPKRTVFACKVCGSEGNQISVYEVSFAKLWQPAFGKEQKKKLSSVRGLPREAFNLDDHAGWDAVSNTPVWIVRRHDGIVTGFRKCSFSERKDPLTHKNIVKAKILNAKGCKLGLLGIDKVTPQAKGQVYICEGEWDRIAMLYLLHHEKEPGIVCAVPGASNFTQEWGQALKDRDVVLLYDNDKAGTDGMVRAGKFIKAYAKSIKFMVWPSDKPEGFDIHDLVKENYNDDTLSDAFLFITNNLVTGALPGHESEEEQERKEIENDQEKLTTIGVEQLHKRFRKWLHLKNCDLLDVIMGTLWSIYLPGSPLWVFAVAPPASSKSETLMPASGWHRCYPISNVSSRGLISGYQMPGGEDPSLFALLQGKSAALIIKDITPVLSGPEIERTEVFGILRDAYDGTVQKPFGNGIKRVYTDLKFNIIAGVTPAIDTFGSVALGERFLKFRSDKELERSDDIAKAMRAIMNCGNETEMRTDLKDACVRSLVRKYALEKVPTPSKKFAEDTAQLAAFCAKMRAVAPSDKFSDIQSMAPLRESPTRLAIQFTKFAQGLALHFETKTLEDPRVFRLVKRIAIHTPDILTMRIVQALFDLHHCRTIDINMLRERIPSISISTAMAVCTVLSRTKAVDMVNTGAKKGYKLSMETYRIIEKMGLFRDLPENDPLQRNAGFRLVRPN